MNVKLSKYAVNNYPHFVSFPLTFCIFNIFDKNKYRFYVCCCRTCLCCLCSLCRCTFYSGDIGLLSVNRWYFWSTCMFLLEFKHIFNILKTHFPLYLFLQGSFFQYLLDGMFFPRFSSGGGIKSSIFCIKSANSSRKLYNEDLLLWNCNELLRISDPRWESEWSQSITTSHQSLNIISGLDRGRDKTRQHCGDSLSTGAAPMSALERNINWRKYLMATLTVSPRSLLKLH